MKNNKSTLQKSAVFLPLPVIYAQSPVLFFST